MEAQKLTFFEKKQTVCPVCDGKFYREDLLSGGGRLIASDLTPELRRLYEPSRKFGEVSPLVYPVTVCPTCYFSSFAADFTAIPDKGLKKAEQNGGRGAAGRPSFSLSWISLPRGRSSRGWQAISSP